MGWIEAAMPGEYEWKKCIKLQISCVLAKRRWPKKRTKHELCSNSKYSSCGHWGLICDFGVCRYPHDLAFFSNVFSNPSTRFESPEQNIITSPSMPPVSHNLFIVGMQCLSTSCSSYRLVFHGNNRKPRLLPQPDVALSISQKDSAEASVSCKSHTLASNIFCSSSTTEYKNCDGISLGCSHPRANFRVVGNETVETEF